MSHGLFQTRRERLRRGVDSRRPTKSPWGRGNGVLQIRICVPQREDPTARGLQSFWIPCRSFFGSLPLRRERKKSSEHAGPEVLARRRVWPGSTTTIWLPSNIVGSMPTEAVTRCHWPSPFDVEQGCLGRRLSLVCRRVTAPIGGHSCTVRPSWSYGVFFTLQRAAFNNSEMLERWKWK